MTETPIGEFDKIGDWDGPEKDLPRLGYSRRTWDEKDRKILASPKVISKIKTAWSSTPFVFDQYFYAGKITMQHIQYGQVYKSDLAGLIGDEAAQSVLSRQSKASISVIHTNNLADIEPISMTGWMLAHRTAHAIDGIWDRPVYANAKKVFCQIFKIYDYFYYGKDQTNSIEAYMDMFRDDAQNPEGSFTEIAAAPLTMKSATQGRMVGTQEALYECVAQYIINGAVKFKSFPRILSKRKCLDPEGCHHALMKVETKLNIAIEKILQNAQGKIFMM